VRGPAAIAVGVAVFTACAGSSPTTIEPSTIDPNDSAAPGVAVSTAAPRATEPPPSSEQAPPPTDVRPPSLGLGDGLFPDLGSADVDVVSYDVRLTVPNEVGAISATLVADIEVTRDVAVLPLDAVGLDVATVTVDDAPTTFEAVDSELLIDLPAERERSVVAVIDYSFTPDGGRSVVGLPIGWRQSDGRSYVLNEPDGARTWLPANDHPSDKATWRFDITVPPGVVAVANGELRRRGDDDGSWSWVQDEPMSTYLVQLIVGDYEIVDGGSVPSGSGRMIPLTHVTPSGERDTFAAAFAGIGARMAFFEERFGPYPLQRYGLAFVDDLSNLAMETQGRSLFGASDFTGGTLGYFQELLLAHELAHQWFGNAVSPAAWTDIWLNESVTTYAQWLWLDHAGLQPLDGYADAMLRQRQSGGGSTGEPSLADMFGFNRYDGGAVVVHALRATLGDDAFFDLMERWVADHVGTSQSTDTFIALAEQVHGDDLGGFFDAWLYADTLPDSYP